ncbi:pyridoxamine 5'-phosphate oxidase family protein [Paenibacillus sp. N3/727]|uniref:pyridoxamine 5'-phosphate oxidase family protein n=1 Tax=Paenibacillus sp. N3/727 TaxID=2925845 RepID=UPI001F536801|nr:pyridoxamine 5'-phosphate oxidase family protein [Paenibacillus sp. N3/727]UNK20081.1 pyridoxamine 5'-phosphate oxidase family protein [Paenibacillus sp. N3/727]
MSQPTTQLTEALMQKLQPETFVLLNTVDAVSGGPTSSVISWIYAVDPFTLRLAIDHRSRLVNNLKQNPLVTVTVYGDRQVFAIGGRAEVRQDPLDEVPFEMCCFDIHVEAVRNALFHGIELAASPEYVKIYDERAAEKLDGQVFVAMRKA